MKAPSATEVSRESQRVLVGALGGISAIAVKYLSQDHATVLQYLDAARAGGIPGVNLFTLLVDYTILAPITIFLGGVIGWISGESQRLKLFAIGVSAPALVTTWSGSAAQQFAAIFDISPVSTAYAQMLSKGEQAFAVQVGSFTERERAVEAAERINAEDFAVHAFVSEFQEDGGPVFHRVRVTSLLSLREALSLRERMVNGHGFTDANVVEVTAERG